MATKRATRARSTSRTGHATTARRKTAAKSATARRKTAARKAAATRARKTASRAKSATRPATRHKSAGRRMTNGSGRIGKGRASPAQSVAKPAALGMMLTAVETKVAKELMMALPMQETPEDAIAMLIQDHRKVEELFEEFENTESKRQKAELAAKICLELRVHTQLEEELLYPDAHHEIEHDLVDEAVVEHASAKDLIAQIEAADPSDHLYDAKMKVLKEYIKHHVKEEEEEMFPKLKGHDLDFHHLAGQMTGRKEQLLKQLARARA